MNTSAPHYAVHILLAAYDIIIHQVEVLHQVKYINRNNIVKNTCTVLSRSSPAKPYDFGFTKSLYSPNKSTTTLCFGASYQFNHGQQQSVRWHFRSRG